jgi:hypothetical protein
MGTGPVEYVVLGFPGTNLTGAIATSLGELVRNGTIRVLDLVFICKDDNGDVEALEFDELEALDALSTLDGEVGGLIGPDDIDYVGDGLADNTSALLLIWEDVWAAPLLETLRSADGVLIEGARVPHDLIDAAISELSAVG